MAVDSVSASQSAPIQPTRTQDAETQRAERPRPEAKPREEEASKPVVNTQGQTTGTRINTTA